MSHDSHATDGGHDSHDAVVSYSSPQEYLEPSIKENLPVGYIQSLGAYLWPLGLSLLVGALMIYVLFFASPSPPSEHPSEGLNQVTVTATAEPSAVVLSSPSPTAGTVAAFGVTPTALPTDTPSPTAIITPTATLTPTATPIAGTVPSPPTNLLLGSTSFRVAPAIATNPEWQYQPDVTMASWIANSYTPYILGIPYSDANAALLAAVKSGDEITLQNESGAPRFRVDSIKRVAPDNIGNLAGDNTPGLIIYLLGDPADTRLQITASVILGP